MPRSTQRIQLLFFVSTLFVLSGTLRAVDFYLEYVSVSQAGLARAGYNPSPSQEGRYVAFYSFQSLVPADTDSRNDVYVRDRETQQTILVSVSNDEVKANGAAQEPVIGANGRFVLFKSTATNLVPEMLAASWNLFLRDLVAEETTFIAPVGTTGLIQAVITPDGRYIAFATNANNLIAGDTFSDYDVFRYDRQTDALDQATLTAPTLTTNVSGTYPTISDDGRYITFTSGSNSLIIGDTNLTDDIFRRDMQLGATIRVSVGFGATQSNGKSESPVMTPDGRYIAFRSAATNLVSPATTSFQIFRHDAQTGQNVLVSISGAGVLGNGVSSQPSISADGRFVAFESFANNFVPNDTNLVYDLFLRDIQGEDITRINLTESGGQTASGSKPILSADGQFVAFRSYGDYAVIVNNVFLPLPPQPDPLAATPQLHLFDTLTPTLTWNRISWADHYEVQVADNANFTNATPYDTTGLTLQTNTLQDNKTYFWRVRGVDDPNAAGDWSATQRFTIIVP